MWIRLPETLKPENRRPLTLSSVVTGFKMVMTNRMSLWYTLAMAIIMGALFGFINSAQQVYVGIYGLGVWFPVAFAAVAGMMSMASFANSRLVMRYGMRRMSHGALIGFILGSLIDGTLRAHWPGSVSDLRLAVCLCDDLLRHDRLQLRRPSPWSRSARWPARHRPFKAFLQTMFGAVIGALIGQAFDGTVLPIIA